MVTGPRAQRTRQRLQAAALDLARRQGFEATTVAEIAAAAGVTPMTFFRHFPTKEDVVLDDPYDPVLADAVRSQPRDLPPLERVRRAVLAAWAALPEPADAVTRERVALAVGSPSLMARAWQNNRRTELAVAEALVETGVPRAEAAVAAGACFGALMAALLDWGAAPDGGLGSRVVAAMAVLATASEVEP